MTRSYVRPRYSPSSTGQVYRPSPTAGLENRVGADGYRSRGEQRLAGFFERYRIPFAYEQSTPVMADGQFRTWHPDFTLPTFGNLIVEYAGMMDKPDYRDSLAYKQLAYAANGRYTVVVLPEDLAGPDWEQRLTEKMRRASPRP